MRASDRSHVKLLGPPGAGKSAVHGRLTSDPRYYGGIYEDALERLILDSYDGPARLAYRLLSSRLRSYAETLVLQYPIRKRLFSAFLLEQPSFPDAMVGARRAVSREPDQAVSLLRDTAERYQLGIETARPDEGFMMGSRLDPLAGWGPALAGGVVRPRADPGDAHLRHCAGGDLPSTPAQPKKDPCGPTRRRDDERRPEKTRAGLFEGRRSSRGRRLDYLRQGLERGFPRGHRYSGRPGAANRRE